MLSCSVISTWMPREVVRQVGEDLGVAQARRAEVDRQEQSGRPVAGRGKGPGDREHLQLESVDPALREREHLVHRDAGQVREAGECLVADESTGGEVDDRLEHGDRVAEGDCDVDLVGGHGTR